MSTNSPDGTSARSAPVRKVRVAALGCKVSGVEAAAMKASLVAAGLVPAGRVGEADLVVVQTCTVTERADRDARRLIRRLRRESPGARVVVTGCLARRDPASVAAMPGVDLVAGRPAAETLLAALGPARLLPSIEAPPALPLVQHEEGRTRAFLSVQDGCSRRCAFCIVPSVRGPERSADPRDVARRVHALAASGVQEVVLSGVHLAAFAKGRGGLAALMDALDADPPACRVRLSSLEPMEAGEALVRRVAASRVVVPHLHVPLQSGSDAVLRRMRRGITAGRFLRLAEAALGANPRLHLATDLIAGFPGETESQHAETLALAARLPFGSLHVFPFSPRSGTRAAELPGRLPHPVVTARAGQLRALAAEKEAAFAARAEGTLADVLVLRDGTGLTDHYLPVRPGAGAPGPGGRFTARLHPAAGGPLLVARPVDIPGAAP